jgi:small subunit ribosomal protein S2
MTNRWEDSEMTPVVTMRQLLEAGVHFGHQTRRWNPKMHRFIWGERNGIYIIDLGQTIELVGGAYAFTRDMVAGGGTVLFVGTKKQAQDPISQAALSCSMPYVNHRWLGGMLTNFRTISGRVQKMLDYERMQAVGDFEAMPKKEALSYSRELDKLRRNLGGIRAMTKLPDALFVLDTNKEAIAVTEARRLGIPVVAVVDTNCDPDVIDWVIPGNDDAIRSTTLMSRIIAEAVKEGRFIGSRRGTAVAPDERTPEEEARIAAEQARAQREAVEQARVREARIAARQDAEPAERSSDEAGPQTDESSDGTDVAAPAEVAAVDAGPPDAEVAEPAEPAPALEDAAGQGAQASTTASDTDARTDG